MPTMHMCEFTCGETSFHFLLIIKYYAGHWNCVDCSLVYKLSHTFFFFNIRYFAAMFDYPLAVYRK